jgi:putative membrane protein
MTASPSTGPVGLGALFTNWDPAPGAIAFAVVAFAAGVLYLLAAAQPSPRGRRWPPARTACFAAGIVLLILIFDGGLQVYEDHPAIHVTQHLLTMMAAPALLAFGAPIALLLRTLPLAGRRRVVRELHDPALTLVSGPKAAVLLPLDYYATMYIYQLTPLHTWAEQHPLLHAAIHGYMLLCGLLFWMPIAGLDPVRFRPGRRLRRGMVALGVPAFGLLGAIELLAGQTATGWAYVIAGTALTAFGLALIATADAARSGARLRGTGRSRSRSPVHTPAAR